MTATQYMDEWRAAGACGSADPEIFFPVSGAVAFRSQTVEAKRICARCQVRQECLDFALRTGESTGIWGGTTPEDRTRTRRAAAARRRHASRDWQLAEARAS